MKSTSQSLDQSIVGRLCILIGLRTGLEVVSWNEILDLTCPTRSPGSRALTLDSVSRSISLLALCNFRINSLRALCVKGCRGIILTALQCFARNVTHEREHCRSQSNTSHFLVIYKFPNLHLTSHARAIHHSKPAPDCLRPRLPAESAVAGIFAKTQTTLTHIVPVQSTCICHFTWYFNPDVSGATGHCTVRMAVRGSYHPSQHVFREISSA